MTARESHLSVLVDDGRRVADPDVVSQTVEEEFSSSDEHVTTDPVCLWWGLGRGAG